MSELDAERVALNDATFRVANEAVRARAAELEVDGGPRPVICECADRGCTQVLLIEPDAYEQIRSDGTRFLHAVGHETADGEHVRVVERHESYVVVEKLGRAGEIARAVDPRKGEG